MRLSYRTAALPLLTACSTAVPAPAPAPARDISVPPASSPAPTLVGTWEATRISYGGIGETLILSPAGTLTRVMGAMVGGRYSLDANKLTFKLDGPNAGAVPTMTLSFAGDTAVISERGNSRRLVAFGGKPAAGSLVGKWWYTHPTGVPAYEEYTPEGTMRLRVPMQVAKGLYTLSGSTISVRPISGEMPAGPMSFTLNGETLTLQIDGRSLTYRRAEPLLPADLEQPRLPRPR